MNKICNLVTKRKAREPVKKYFYDSLFIHYSLYILTMTQPLSLTNEDIKTQYANVGNKENGARKRDLYPTKTHLFRLQRELDENLLQLLVDEVDAELLETVFLKYLESVYVQDSDLVSVRVGLHGRVNFLRNYQLSRAIANKRLSPQCELKLARSPGDKTYCSIYF